MKKEKEIRVRSVAMLQTYAVVLRTSRQACICEWKTQINNCLKGQKPVVTQNI